MRANPGVRLPFQPHHGLRSCGRLRHQLGFSRYLSKMSPGFRTKVGAGQSPAWGAPRIVRGQGNPGVADCVNKNPNSIGYVDLRDTVEAGLRPKVASIGQVTVVRSRIRARGGSCRTRRRVSYIQPTLTALPGRRRAHPRIPEDLEIDTSASPTPGAYPITLTAWVVAYGNYAAAGRDPAGVRTVLQYFYGPQAQGSLPNFGYAPLPAPLLAAAQSTDSRGFP